MAARFAALVAKRSDFRPRDWCLIAMSGDLAEARASSHLIFADIERLAPWELTLAAELFRVLSEAGLRCLNNPARAMSRVELLRSLKAAGFNPFDVTRADEQPRPARFPVFLRFEMDHNHILSDLLYSQLELDNKLTDFRNPGLRCGVCW